MAVIAIAYHSGFGHTKAVAESIAAGAGSVGGVTVSVVNVGELKGPDWTTKSYADAGWSTLDGADCIVFGSPTYMGTVSADFKRFMDNTSVKWFGQAWKDKLAAGFTNSGGLSGDKLNTLETLMIFAGQHSMVWVPAGLHGVPGVVDRIGSYSGLMTQADNAPAEQTPPAGDHATARAFGARVAGVTKRWVRGR